MKCIHEIEFLKNWDLQVSKFKRIFKRHENVENLRPCDGCISAYNNITESYQENLVKEAGFTRT